MALLPPADTAVLPRRGGGGWQGARVLGSGLCQGALLSPFAAWLAVGSYRAAESRGYMVHASCKMTPREPEPHWQMLKIGHCTVIYCV